MRTFSSYSPIDTDLHYYVPRHDLIQFACQQLIGEQIQKGGPYITVWAPRQRGKTWGIQQVLQQLRHDDRFEILYLSLQSLKDLTNPEDILRAIAGDIQRLLNVPSVTITTLKQFETLFSSQTLFVQLGIDELALS